MSAARVAKKVAYFAGIPLGEAILMLILMNVSSRWVVRRHYRRLTIHKQRAV